MATAFYPQPAAANYFQIGANPSHHQRKRGFRICDCCGFQESSTRKLELCGACKLAEYCSRDCQKSHWPAHKSICQHTASQISAAKQCGDEDLQRYLRKFCTAYQDLLGWTGFQALRLKRVPANIRTQALLVELDFHDHPNPLQRLRVKGTHIVPRSYITDRDPSVADEIKRREDRSRHTGGIGCAVILIQCGPICQIMPVEVDAPGKISWDSRDDWAETFAHFVQNGITDFKPISTTSKGIYYG